MSCESRINLHVYISKCVCIYTYADDKSNNPKALEFRIQSFNLKAPSFKFEIFSLESEFSI